ncbi:MAG: DUF2378 family protein [Myxococcota bacterium]
MTTERLVFSHSMEALYRALDPHTPAERAVFQKAGITGERFLPAYPVEVHIAVLDACASSRFAHLPELERYTEVGKLFFGGFEKTIVGSALMAMMRVIGPRRTLDRITRNLRSANNFSEGVITTLAPNRYHVRINYTVRPGFYLGLLESGCRVAGAKELSVTVVETKDLQTTYEVKWA